MPLPGPDEPADEDVISLRQLSEAFAQATGGQTIAEPDAIPESDVQEADTGGVVPLEQAHWQAEPPSEEEARSAEDDDPCPLSPRTILEAMLFVGCTDGTPLSSVRAASLMRGVTPEEIGPLVEELNAKYAATSRPYYVVNEGNGYRMTLRSAHAPLRDQFYGRVREAKLSQAAIDVLAIVAYQQPITVEKVNALRGRPCNHVLAQLVRRRLLRIERPEDTPRMVLYFTTDRFLELFALGSLADLPHPADFDARS